MNPLKEVLRHEVFPALGCTEPIAVAYAASVAAKELSGTVERIRITVDPGVFKNGFAVAVPNTEGEKGILIAAALGALIAQPGLKMEILSGVDPTRLRKAREMIGSGAATMACDRSQKGLFIDAEVNIGKDAVRAMIRQSHTHLVRLEKNGRVLFEGDSPDGGGIQAYKERLKAMKIADVVGLARDLDAEDARTIQKGIDMNLAIAEAGRGLKKVGYYVSDLCSKGFIEDDIFSSSKILTASAVDARMAGLNYPVMSSGGSGNQGVVAILVPYHVGRHFRIEEAKILESIALSHMVNSYIKCFTGELSPLCGCAIASGVGAAVAVVYQQCGEDADKITLAVNNVISDLGGMLCDGAKGGCALKVASSTDSAIRAAYMAINGHGITHREGFVGRTAEESIRHLSRISRLGMEKADDTMLGIMLEKET